ncbi:hypothetical protein BaRGS_00032441 [Batillaria attramentaria]|uniref:Uncharacterized protein n=1 Tax=Batillaria attramentaria TaxID=370345 RepID=A0ABD0JNQ9_9CAEN|nr:hypothetical protein BaRGS_014139 [Batillaria attramentaria]
MDDTTSAQDAPGSPSATYQNFAVTPESGSHSNPTFPTGNYDRVDVSKAENHLYDKHVASAAAADPGANASDADPIYQNAELAAAKQERPKIAKKPGKGFADEPEAVYGNVDVS